MGSPVPEERTTHWPRVIRHALTKPRGRIVVLRKHVQKVYEPVDPPKLPSPAKSLAEEAQSLNVVMVDLFGNAVTEAFNYKCELREDGLRSGALSSDGMARQEGLKPGDGTIEFPALHADAWFPRAAPPDGWLRSGFSLSLVDALGAPIGKRRFKVTFQNGTVAQGELDEAALARLERTPSYPLLVEFPDFDAERWL